MDQPDARRPPVFDWLAAAAGLLGGSLLLSSRHRRRAVAEGQFAGEAELDDSARLGRGRPRTPPSRAAKRQGHETQDADAGAIGLAMFGLAVAAVGAVLGMLLLLGLFHHQLRADRPVYTAEQSTPLDPPRPQLEAHPETDLHRQQAGQQALLDRYAWADAAHTRVRLPIARAMQLVAGRSLDAAP